MEKENKPGLPDSLSAMGGQCDTKCLNSSVRRAVCGCVAEDTRIALADGCEREIKDVRIGERVANERLDHPVTVTNIMIGVEQMLYCLSLANGSTLMATGTHPVLTEEGFKPMQELTTKDSVRTPAKGSQQVKDITMVKYEDRVYNLELSGDSHAMVCNGLIVGDFQMENNMLMKR
ncbi:MAG: Hint domain-containing protein [Bacillota bacterium]